MINCDCHTELTECACDESDIGKYAWILAIHWQNDMPSTSHNNNKMSTHFCTEIACILPLFAFSVLFFIFFFLQPPRKNSETKKNAAAATVVPMKMVDRYFQNQQQQQKMSKTHKMTDASTFIPHSFTHKTKKGDSKIATAEDKNRLPLCVSIYFPHAFISLHLDFIILLNASHRHHVSRSLSSLNESNKKHLSIRTIWYREENEKKSNGKNVFDIRIECRFHFLVVYLCVREDDANSVHTQRHTHM